VPDNCSHHKFLKADPEKPQNKMKFGPGSSLLAAWLSTAAVVEPKTTTTGNKNHDSHGEDETIASCTSFDFDGEQQQQGRISPPAKKKGFLAGRFVQGVRTRMRSFRTSSTLVVVTTSNKQKTQSTPTKKKKTTKRRQDIAEFYV
jgi:hypothetical protein